MLKTKLFAILLFAVMVLNIMRYQMPYIEYNLFKGYIAENLCVKKEEKGNCCQGKCFLNKQIKETEKPDKEDNTANNSNNRRPINLEVNEFLCIDINAGLAPLETSKRLYPRSEIFHTDRITSEIFVPPKLPAKL